MQKLSGYALAAVAAAFLAVGAPDADAKGGKRGKKGDGPVATERSFAGSAVVGSSDVDGDGNPGSITTSSGKGTLGKFTTSGTSELAPWDGISVCGPTEIKQFYVATSSVATYKEGDLIASVMDTSPPSFLCFDFTNGTFELEIHRVVVGGTGRFEGATGSDTVRARGRTIQLDGNGGTVQSIFSGESAGTVIFGD